MASRSHACSAAFLAAGLIVSAAGGKVEAQSPCRSLVPIGGTGEPVVQKRISPDRLVGRSNWNTDFTVDRGFSSYRVKLQSASTAQGTFPLAVFLPFTDGSNLQVVNQNLTLAPQEQRNLGPFPTVPGKRTSQVNVRVGASSMPGSTGFSYRVSAQGCH
jgi:hypothetical protein